MFSNRISRRRFIGQGTAAMVAGMSPELIPAMAHATAVELNEDGLHIQPWFLESFLDLTEDVTGAVEADKHFAIMWEVKGCPFCRKTHEVNFANDRIRDYIIANFEVLQLNVIGSRLVTDLDGTEMSEKNLAAKYGVRYTPTIQFFPKTIAGIGQLDPRKREATRLQGYLEPKVFLSMFQYVASESYKNKSFRKYLETNGS